MDLEYELTESDYKRAIANGITRDQAYKRFYNLGWDKERAVTEPVNKKVDRKHWHRIAAEHGISRDAFNTRLHRGWSEERAATTPKITIEGAQKKAHEALRKYPIELLQKAVDNGISEQTFRRRIREGWGAEKAATKPIYNRQYTKELINK